MAEDYHAAIGFPEDPRLMVGRFDVRPTDHARERAREHRYGPFDLPEAVAVTEEMYRRDPYDAVRRDGTAPHVFEITVERGRVEKAAVRYHYNDTFDQTVVVTRDGTLVTAWLNRRNDDHSTLDESAYASP